MELAGQIFMQDRDESSAQDTITKLSVVIPCFNEEKTLQRCIERVRGIADAHLRLEIIIVDDHSTDKSLLICRELESKLVLTQK
jgi:glycosyltransferase involved in cell wall biosynthesis